MSRTANFSSSQIYRLTKSGQRPMTDEELAKRPKSGKGSRTTLINDVNVLDKVAMNYIKEKVRESKLKRPIDVDVNTRPMIWGKIMEMYVFAEKLGVEYRDMNHAGRLTHHELERNTGVPDFLKGKPGEGSVVCEMKAPTSFVKFCDYYDNTSNLEDFKENHEDHYWQIVNNAMLTFSEKGEFIWYIPYASELPKIMEFVQGLDEDRLPKDLNPFQVKWITDEIFDFVESEKEPSIPYLPDDSDYNDLNFFAFDIPEKDINYLTNRIKIAQDELINSLKH